MNQEQDQASLGTLFQKNFIGVRVSFSELSPLGTSSCTRCIVQKGKQLVHWAGEESVGGILEQIV